MKDCIVKSNVYQILSWTPPNYRWDPEHPPTFSLGLNIRLRRCLHRCQPLQPTQVVSTTSKCFMLYFVFRLLTKYSVLVQARLIAFLTSATFTNFWTTLTFLLSSPQYNYKPRPIGLIGIFGTVFIPASARLVVDRYVPLFSVITGELINLAAVTIGTYTGTFTVADPVTQALFLDAGLQTVAVANRNAIYAIEPKARNRVNTAYMLATF